MAAVAERRRSWDALMDGVHLMKALTRVQRQQLSCLLETKECEVGEVLGAEDEPGDRMWMVLQARLFFFTLVPVRPRSRGERRSLRTFPPPPPPLVAAPAAQQTRRVNSVRSSDGASPPAMETKSSGAAAADASIARAALRVEGPFKAMISGWS